MYTFCPKRGAPDTLVFSFLFLTRTCCRAVSFDYIIGSPSVIVSEEAFILQDCKVHLRS